jgi:hypothetical protein
MATYPIAPDSMPDDQKKAWNQLIKLLQQRDLQPLGAPAGSNYLVSGTVTVACCIHLGEANVTNAVVQGFAKLLSDFRSRNIINVVLK